MRVVITGGAGFLGSRLAEALQQKGSLSDAAGTQTPIEQILLVDQTQAVERPGAVPEGCEVVGGDISDRRTAVDLLGSGPVAVFHLASVVSGHGEQDFDLALRVNLDGARHLLEACRAHDQAVRLTTTSSLAVFGPASGDPVSDDSLVQPATTYGMTKAILELMINDYSRKGYLDGRAARLPTVIIRPGSPNAAASSAASAIFREPLAGRDFRLPLDPATLMAVASVESVIDNLITLHELAGDALEARRTVTFPGVSGTFEEMLAVLRDQVSADQLGQVSVEPDPAVQTIVRTWPTQVDGSRAVSLGLRPADDLATTLRAYRARYV